VFCISLSTVQAVRGLQQLLVSQGKKEVAVTHQGLQVQKDEIVVGDIDGLVETDEVSYVVEAKLHGKVHKICHCIFPLNCMLMAFHDHSVDS